MAIRFITKSQKLYEDQIIQNHLSKIGKKKCGKAKPIPFTGDINQPGRLRIGNLISMLGVSHSGLYTRIKSGAVPPPDGKDGKRPYWLTSTIKPLVTKQ